MTHYRVTIAGRTYQVDVPDTRARPLKVIVDGVSFEVAVEDAVPEKPEGPAQDQPARRASAAASEEGARPMAVIGPIPPQRATPAGSAPVQDAGHDLAAPMAGTVVSIEVTPGQQVGAGEVLCVLEAMKMKNPLRSPAAGTVTEIVAQAGQSVAYGDVLVRLS